MAPRWKSSRGLALLVAKLDDAHAYAVAQRLEAHNVTVAYSDTAPSAESLELAAEIDAVWHRRPANAQTDAFVNSLDAWVVSPPGNQRAAATPIQFESARGAGLETLVRDVRPALRDFHVTVVGEELFAAELRHGRPLRSASLPRYVELGIGTLMRDLGLHFATIDLTERQDGEHIFRGLDPQGHFLHVEMATRLPISAALADLLATPLNQYRLASSD